jgi:Tol biopolymer transport system component
MQEAIGRLRRLLPALRAFIRVALRDGLRSGPVFLACLALGSAETLTAQEPGSVDSVPVIQPRLERLWGSDSLNPTANMGGPAAERKVALSPDGRRILLASYDPAGVSRLWLAPIEGGEMVSLTGGDALEDWGQWYPSGDAIAFTSPRLGENRWFRVLMRLPLSAEDGRPLGPARQVSLEPVHPYAISPDGNAIAYVADRDPNAVSGSTLKVIPATGGSPTAVLASPKGLAWALRWGEDGRNLYLLNSRVDRLALSRVSLDGGEPELLSFWEDWVYLSPGARYLVRKLPSPEGEPLYEVATLRGWPLARFHLPGSLELAGFTHRGEELLAVRRDVVHPLRVVPVAGGPIRQLNEAWGYDVPLGWRAGGSEVFFQTELNGETAFMFAPVDGGPIRQVPLPENTDWEGVSADGDYILYAPESEAGHERSFIYDMERDTTVTVELPDTFDAGPFWSFTISESGRPDIPGGEGAIFGYGVNRNGRHVVYMVDRSGRSTLGWSFRAHDPGGLQAQFPRLGQHGSRIAFTENDGREGTLFLVRAGDEEARPLLRLPGSLSARGSPPVPEWSPDGRLLALSHRPPDRDEKVFLLAEVNEAGELVGEPRPLSLEGLPEGGWSFPEWMPDGEQILVMGPKASGVGWGVWLVSLDAETPPREVTADLDEGLWYYYLSPDGRYIAPEGEGEFRGSSVWRVDLGGVLKEAGR